MQKSNTVESILSRIPKLVGDDCQEWPGGRFPYGYGNISYFGKGYGAHRLIWTFINGPIPEGMCVCHRCDNPPCVRIDHLFLGTIADNNADKKVKGRSPTGDANPSKRSGEKISDGVRRHLRDHPEQRLGSNNPNSKLTESDVAAIRAMYGTGKYRHVDVAKQFGVSQATVSHILNGRTWKPENDPAHHDTDQVSA